MKNNLKLIIKLLKINHHIKNVVVFIPLIFSLKFLDIIATISAFWAFIAFCLIASAVYVFNDITDVNNDKLHPTKKNRPIASGTVSVHLAWKIFILFVLGSFALALSINKLVFLSVFSYLLLNIWYSLKLKSLPIIDVVCIAIGFVLRVFAGCGAILVVPSPLVILLTFFTSMFFTFAKRKLEYRLFDGKSDFRKSINEYNEPLLNMFVSINAVLSIAFYFTYMLDFANIQRVGTKFLYVTVIPFSIIIFVLLFRIYTCSNNDDLVDIIYRDKIIKISMLIYLIVLFAVLIIK